MNGESDQKSKLLLFVDDEDAPVTRAWRDILNAIPALVFALTPRGEVIFLNDYFSRYTGLPVEALLANRWPEVIHPDDLPDAAASLASGLAGDAPFIVRQRIRSGDGSYRYYEALTFPYRDPNGRIVQWFGVENDVEDLMSAIARLEQVEAGLRTALNSVPQIIWTADASGWIEWYNDKWYSFTGQTVAESAGWGWQAAHHPVDFPRVMEHWPESIRTGEPFEMEFRLRRADGVFRWMLTRIVPVKDHSGAVLRWYGSNTEIEEQKQAEQRSRRVSSLLHEAVLPQTLPAIASLRIDALYESAESDALVGGDWYDAVALDNDRVLLSCGDVTGHGLEAAAFALRLRHMISFAGRENPDPASVLSRVNAIMVAEDGPLATAAIALLDVAACTVTIALAGHPPPIIVNAGAPPYTIAPGGVPLGITRSVEPEAREIALTPGAVVLLYTDGITEFGRDVVSAERALEVAAAAIADDPGMVAPARFVKDEVLRSAESGDDVVILVAQLVSADALDTPRSVPLSKTWRFHSSHSLSAHNARVEVAAYLAALAAEPRAIAEAELVVGELLANTVEHAPGLVELRLDWTTEFPRLVVRDSGRGVSLGAGSLPDPLSEDGRGLFLIHAFASDVVIAGMPTVGTEVSCTLRLTRATSGRSLCASSSGA